MVLCSVLAWSWSSRVPPSIFPEGHFMMGKLKSPEITRSAAGGGRSSMVSFSFVRTSIKFWLLHFGGRYMLTAITDSFLILRISISACPFEYDNRISAFDARSFLT